MSAMRLARSEFGVKNTILKPLVLDMEMLHSAFSNPRIGEKGGSYITRASGLVRADKQLAPISDALIFDGDSRIDTSGNIVSGAPHINFVVNALAELGVDFLISSSHSNGATKEELEARNINSGGLYGADYFKYRIYIRCTYSCEQLQALVEHGYFCPSPRKGKSL